MLVLHPLTVQQTQAYQATPPHALILVGPPGSGKKALAQQMIAGLLAEDVHNHPYVMQLTGGTSGIEDIRLLEQFLARKVPGSAPYNRAVVIDGAHNLAHEAQNALLKLLEEPPTGTVFILTSAHRHGLLPTIQSRAQLLQVHTPTKQQLEEYYSQTHTAADIKRAYAMSGGLPGLMTALLEDSQHPLIRAASMARDVLTRSSFERLALVDVLAKDRQLAIDTMFMLQQMAHLKLLETQGVASRRWQKILQASYDTAQALSVHAQAKLALTAFMLRLA